MVETPSDADINEGSVPSRFSNPLIIAWQHKALVALGLAIGLAIGVLYYSQKTPVYQSSTQILVIKKRADALPVAGLNLSQVYVEDYLATHTVLLRSQELLRRAAKVLSETHPDAIPAGVDPAGFIASGLSVAREGTSGPTNVLNLSFRGENPEHCPHVLNAVKDAYNAFLNVTYVDLNEEFIKQMEHAESTLRIDIEAKQQEYHEIKLRRLKELKENDGSMVLQERIGRLESKRADLQLRLTEIETRQAMVIEAVKDKKDPVVILKILEGNSTTKSRLEVGTAKSNRPEDLLRDMEQHEQELLLEFGKDHPQVVTHRQKMELVRNRLGGQPAAAAPAKAINPVDVAFEAMNYEHRETEKVREELDRLILKDRKVSEDIARFNLEEEKSRKSIEPLQQLYDRIINQMQQNKLKGDSGGYDARTIVDAGIGSKVSPHLLQTLIAASFLGLVGGMGLAYLAEMTDKSFRTPEEIRQRLGLRVIGHIPHIEVAKGELVGGLDPQLCAAHAPMSMSAEAFRGLRTALYFSIQGRGHQVIQLTSPHMGDGKSTLAANLAISIAQSGKSVVLIDADFRRPKVHKFFNIVSPVGLASVISGDVELPDAIQPCAVPGLFLLPCGPRPSNPAELLTSPRFQDLLKVIREKYDFVLIDTPPLLVVSDPAAVAPRVDGVILALRVTKNSRPMAERAKEVLTSLGANILGIVVNGLNDNAGRYSYGSGYRYEYRYGYVYDTNYTDDEDNSDDVKTPHRLPSTNGHS